MLPDPTETPFLNADDLLKLMPLSRASIYQGLKEGDIPSIRVGKRILVPTAAFLRLLGADPHDAIKDAAEPDPVEDDAWIDGGDSARSVERSSAPSQSPGSPRRQRRRPG